MHAYGTTPVGQGQHQVFLTHSVARSADLDGSLLPSVISSYQYDAYGNPTQIVVSTSDGHTKTTTNTYANDTMKWLLGRLTRATVASPVSEPGAGGPDAVPDAFGFTDLTEQPLASLIASNSISISGIDTAVPVIVTGDGAPQIRINGGSWATSGTLTNGQSLEVRLTSSNAKNQTRTAMVTVGATSATWSVTTTNCNLVAEGCLFSSAGDYTYTVPAGVTSIRVTAVGGGGGFGSRNHSSWHGYGGAGGGSATKTLAVTAGQSFNLKVGPGGNSAPSDWGSWCNCHGSDGGASSFSSVLSATGGQGGYRNTAAYNVEAKSGMGSGGDQNCSGGNGTQGTYEGAIGLPGQCGGGAGGPSGAGGGASPIGGAGRSGLCGAGDGRSDSRNKGADGCVLITPNPPPWNPGDLYNGVHTSANCTSANGTVVSIGSASLCRFTGANCPSGWGHLTHWTTTSAKTCQGVYGGDPCSTGSHAWANKAPETCTYTDIGGGDEIVYLTCTANRTAIGCY
jgi:hypothetical protein